MLYAAGIKLKDTSPTTWFLVNSKVFKDGHDQDPYVIVKSNLKKLKKAVETELKTSKDALVWSRGQGTRTLHDVSLDEFKVIELTGRLIGEFE